jgi:hypothetical protein
LVPGFRFRVSASGVVFRVSGFGFGSTRIPLERRAAT